MPTGSYERIDSLSGHVIIGGSKGTTRPISNGLWQFIVTSKWAISLSLSAGIAIELGVIIFTFWLSRQRTLSCPDWAVGCKVPWSVQW